ncbi:bloodthirsty [Silurus meridionalis]|nr:bloodthirsty [Silurus meridionalis]
MPLATSLAIFQSCNITGVPKSTRCAILRDMAKVRKAESRPPLNKTHKLKRQDWAKKYLKTDFSKVLWTDEMRVSLDGPDGWAHGWIGKGQRAPVRLRRQQGGGGVLVWAGIIKDELVGPFRVEDGVKLNSQSYCQFLEDTFFKQWYRKKSASFKKNMIFMQDNAPSHTSKYSTAWLARKGIKEENLMIWPPCSPDLNPIENLWSIIKCAIYKEGKQYTSLNSVWEAVVAAARNVDGEQIKTLTESMDGRLLSVLAKKAQLQVFGPDDHLVAEAGKDLVLPCYIKPSTSVVEMTVRWLKQETKHMLVHLYKDHVDRNEDQAQSYRRRTSLFTEELQKGNASLRLSALRVSDEGEYTCFIGDESWSDDITFYVIVNALGSHPVIMMESYDNSGGIHLLCESRGWKPEPVALWLDREGVTLPAEDTQTHRDTEGFNVKRSITVHDNSNHNRFYCRLLQEDHMRETEIIINQKQRQKVEYILSHKKKFAELQSRSIEDGNLIKVCEIYSVKNNLAKMKKFAVDVILDPDTAHPYLILSADGKQVTCGDEWQNLPDTPQRFNLCPCVVGRQSFSSGRFYYEVQVREKTEWYLGVVRENINRKGEIILRPRYGFWTVGLRNENQYKARAGPSVPLTLREKVEKVGVFVDYEEGLVSFYEVNSRSHIYTFTGQTFTEKLYPFFSPDLNNGEKQRQKVEYILSDKKLFAELQSRSIEDDLEKMKKFAVDVILDPDTANPYLILSDDGKQVTCGDERQNLPDTPQRFTEALCVLGKQSFSSGRFYYEVQVRGKTKWDLGVVRENINRKGEIKLRPQYDVWTVWLRNENQYKALAGPSVPLTLREKVGKVGVFVDYEEGLVSFYDVNSRSHIYSFTDMLALCNPSAEQRSPTLDIYKGVAVMFMDTLPIWSSQKLLPK